MMAGTGGETREEREVAIFRNVTTRTHGAFLMIAGARTTAGHATGPMPGTGREAREERQMLLEQPTAPTGGVGMTKRKAVQKKLSMIVMCSEPVVLLSPLRRKRHSQFIFVRMFT